jgi:hypothetical protein
VGALLNQANIGVEAGIRWPAKLAAFLKNEIRAHSIVYALILLLLSETIIVSWWLGDPLIPFLEEYARRATRAAVLVVNVAFILAALYALFQRTGETPLQCLKRIFLQLWKRNILPRYGYACAVVTVFMAAFLYNKTIIPKLNPFDWDATFAEWDRLLFGGSHPWELLHPFVSVPAITIVLDFMYTIWVPLFLLSWCLIFVSPHVSAELRHRYWLATVAGWILIGLVMATVFSSAGPCYFAYLVPGSPSPYAELEKYLSSVNDVQLLGSSLTKEYLWAIYTGAYDAPGGISAMPSMHNAQAVLFAAAAYQINRRLGHLMLAYAAIIFVGSIHLAWHYAVDGIVGAVGALALWWLAGVSVRRQAKILTAAPNRI